MGCMLDIRTRFSGKKGTVVYLYVKHKMINQQTGNVVYKYKMLTSFILEKGYGQEVLELLNDEEVLQLKNWLAENEFAKKLEVELDDMDSITLRLPNKLLDALSKLAKEGKRAGIEFIPHAAILENLLKTAKLVQGKIDKLNGFESNILESIGVSSKFEERKIDLGDRALFKALLDLAQPVGKTCSELEATTFLLGTNKRIPPEQIKEWAGLMPGRSKEKRVSDWCFYVAGEVLLQHGINPCEIIAPQAFIKYWAAIKKDRLALDQAVKEFSQVFGVKVADRGMIKKEIEAVYKA